jgi:osmoprotectant transport system permease protein
MSWAKWIVLPFVVFLALSYNAQRAFSSDKGKVVVGSKMFGENYIIAEMIALLLEEEGFTVERKFGLGGTIVAYEALEKKKIDVYPEYTGTLSQVILKNPPLDTLEKLNAELKSRDLKVLSPIGFENNYGVAVRKDFAKKHNLQKISDLQRVDFRAAINFETKNREDAWPRLLSLYDLQPSTEPKTLEQTMVFQAMAANEADLMVMYTTDGKIKKYDLKVLEDDRGFSPKYLALPFIHRGVPKSVRKVMNKLAGLISQGDMVQLNERMDVAKIPYARVAREYLENKSMVVKKQASATSEFQAAWQQIFPLALEHIYLVLVSTLAATLFAVPLGVLLFRFQRFARPILYLVGLLQTIPSLALLVYMIPIFGVSVKSALLALFLYSLLPILQNTYSGLQNVSPSLVQAARGIGLHKWETLMSIELPLSAPIIVAGIRVATVINVGTATIAAFIGSGGLGELIVQGLTLNDLWLMQKGALPAAVLAIVFNIVFTKIENRVTYQ